MSPLILTVHEHDARGRVFRSAKAKILQRSPLLVTCKWWQGPLEFDETGREKTRRFRLVMKPLRVLPEQLHLYYQR